ncbi:hypothetical protein M5K25_017015 [Dendrobium thyrsiflorum]|uniref:Uncharacterized protein n=1 Tax=Dendrobium thyrsiflorum TaxID=117978 RepID=A0ABD0UM10_DENTH
MFPKDWTQPCGNRCTKKYAGVFLIPWRIFCKKGCSADGDTWAECVEACNELCYKDPVLKDRQWTSFIDRSPGDDNYSLECFHACVAGCGFKVSTFWSISTVVYQAMYILIAGISVMFFQFYGVL